MKQDHNYTNIGYVCILTQIKEFKRGDEVVIKSDKNLVKELQEGHGGWNESMISVSFHDVSFLLVCLA